MALSEYCIDMAASRGYHWVHDLRKCDDLYLPAPENRIDLGHHYNVQSAFRKARELFENIECCAYRCGKLLS